LKEIFCLYINSSQPNPYPASTIRYMVIPSGPGTIDRT